MGDGCGEGGEDGEGGGRRGGGGQYKRAVLGAACRPTKAVCPGAAPCVGVVGDRCACAHATQLAGAPWVPRCVLYICLYVCLRVCLWVCVLGGLNDMTRHVAYCYLHLISCVQPLLFSHSLRSTYFLPNSSPCPLVVCRKSAPTHSEQCPSKPPTSRER